MWSLIQRPKVAERLVNSLVNNSHPRSYPAYEVRTMVSLSAPVCLLDGISHISGRLWQLCCIETANQFLSAHSKKPYQEPYQEKDEITLAGSFCDVVHQETIVLAASDRLCPFAVSAHFVFQTLRKLLPVADMSAAELAAYFKTALTVPQGEFGSAHWTVFEAVRLLGLGTLRFSDPAKCRPGDLCMIWHVSSDGLDVCDGYAGVVPSVNQVMAWCPEQYKRNEKALWLFGAKWRDVGVSFDYWGWDTSRRVNGVDFERRVQFLRVM